ncbi:preprotein translocase subunit SecE [Candidatus Woesebacteria bacterium]|nr:MAG: preprotein translocase subunit SecE [Candidatus Woesebacteria bacterium]
MNNLAHYLKGVRFELSKVIWPSRSEVIRLTTVVVLISVIVGLYVGGLDYAFTKLIETLLSI